ncbi:MAG: N-succinylarginine dihydrolase [Sneathiella sp.]
MKPEDEYNFDGLVGPSHNFAGLSLGNVASTGNVARTSNPKEAALQGLKKMRGLSKMGYRQAVLPPHERPHIPTLKKLGFSGTDAQIIEAVARSAPHLLAAVSSASAMWAANAATISSAADTADGKMHFTPANLASMFHRAIEPEMTGKILKRIFACPDHFTHHNPLPTGFQFGDEGAANHTRLRANSSSPGLEVFVYGMAAFDKRKPRPAKYPARQTLEASQAIARLHGLSPKNAIFLQQNPNVIDAGVFHNDVISVGNENCFFFHQDAFQDSAEFQKNVRKRLPEIQFIEVPRDAVSVKDAVSTYLFNTQLLSDPENPQHMRLIAPMECKENNRVHAYLENLLEQNTPIKDVSYIDVRESMKNGGGPACLRLRVPLNAAAKSSIKPRVFLDDSLFHDLCYWVEKHYREKLSPEDLADPNLLTECRTALDEVTQIMELGSLYEFQAG